MDLVETDARAVSIALPKPDTVNGWRHTFVDACEAAGLARNSIEELSDKLSSARRVVKGYKQSLDFYSFAGDGAFFATHLFRDEPSHVSFNQNGDLHFEVQLRGVGDTVSAGRNNLIIGPTCMLTYYPPDTVSLRRSAPNQEWVSASVNIRPEALIAEFGMKLSDLPHQLSELLRGNITDVFSLRFPLPADVARALNSIWECADRSSLRQTLMESRGREIVHAILCAAKERDRTVFEEMNAIGVKTAKIEKAQAILETELHVNHSLQSLANRVGLSRTSLSLGFKQWCGMAVFEYLHAKRMEYAKRLLDENRHSVKQVAVISGYQDGSAFSRAYRKHFGTQPTSATRKRVGL